MSSAAVSLATTQPRSRRPSTSGRMPCGSRAAYSVSSSIKTKREGAAQPRQHLERALPRGCVSGWCGEQRGDQRRCRWWCSRRELAAVELAVGPRQVRRPAARSSAVLIRLPLWPSAIDAVGGRRGTSAGRSARCWRRWWSSGSGRSRGGRCSDASVRLVEDLGDQAHVLVDQDLPAVADRDAGRLLAAVLQGVEAEVGQLGDVLAGGPDAEDATGVLRSLLAGGRGRGSGVRRRVARRRFSHTRRQDRSARRSTRTATTAASSPNNRAPMTPR